MSSSLFEGSTRANEAEEARRREAAKRIRCSSSGGPDGSFSLRGATPQELEMLQGMIENRFWVSVNDQGRLERHYKLADVPGPVDDEQMMPFWTPAMPGEVKLELPLVPTMSEHQSPGLQIQGLGAGMHFTPNGYAKEAAKLTGFGFDCMRSKRDEDSGRFWEIWNLGGFWSAKGQLKELISDHKHLGTHEKLEKVIRFLCERVRFGSLEVKWQVAALVYD